MNTPRYLTWLFVLLTFGLLASTVQADFPYANDYVITPEPSAAHSSAAPCFMPYADGGASCPLQMPPALPIQPAVKKVAVPTGEDPPAPLISMKVRVPACSDPESKLEYRVLVQNCSPAPAHHVIIKTRLPKNAKFVRASPEAHATEPELQWRLGTVQAHARCEITLVVEPQDTSDVHVCFRVQYEHGQCVTTRLANCPYGVPPTLLPSPHQEPSTKEPGTKEPGTKEPGKKDGKQEPKIKDKEPTKPPVVEPGRANLTVEVFGPPEQDVTKTATYKITVANIGKAPATNVLATTTLPAKLEFVSASDDGKYLAGQVAWLLGRLDAGASRTVELVLKAKEPGKLCHTTKVLADDGLSAETEACTVFIARSAVLLEMFDRVDPIALGDETSYPVTIHNQGFVPVTNLKLQAIMPPNMDVARAKGPVDHQVQGKSVIYAPLATLAPGETATFEVFGRALAVGDQRFTIQIEADQLQQGGPVRETESTMVFDEDNPPARRVSNRKHRSRVILLDSQLQP